MPWVEPIARRAAWTTIAAVTVGFLYFASHFVIPIALAALLAFMMSPVSRWITRFTRSNLAGVVLTSTIAIAIIVGGGFVVIRQLTDFLERLPTYRHTISQKLVSLQGTGDGLIDRATRALDDIQKDVANAATQPTMQPERTAGVPVSVVSTQLDKPETIFESASSAASIVSPFIEPAVLFTVVCVLAILFLIHGQDMRDRFIVLAGANQISLTSQALEEASQRIGGYLLMQALINTVFGSTIAIGLYFIGVPNAILLGLLAGALRFIPMLGAWLGLFFPALLAVAVFDSWYPVLSVIVLFAITEAIINFIIEPWLYGHSTGISGIAVIVCILFWTWLWGPIGLLLAVPITVCLVVTGKYVETLRIFYVLLSDEPVLSGERRLYHRLITGDYAAAELMIQKSDAELGEVETCDQLLVPVLHTARADRDRGVLSENRFISINDTITGMTGEQPASTGEKASSIACVAVTASDADAALVVGQAIRRAMGVEIDILSHAMTTDLVKRLTDIDSIKTNAIVLISSSPDSTARARLVSKALRAKLPSIRLLLLVLSPTSVSLSLPQQSTNDSLSITTVSSVLDRLQQLEREYASIPTTT